jgi:hypothetical protein
MNNNLTNDQQRLISMYITQYNQTNNHIDQLLDMLDEIRNNITTVLSSGQPRRNRLNRHSRNSNSHINRFINQLFNDGRRDSIRYDYNNPINPRVYNEHYHPNYSTHNTNHNENINRTARYHPSSTLSEPNNLSTFLTNFLNTTVTVRPTNVQIQNASRLIRYRDIENPLSESCPILLDRFQPEQMVRQIIHCGHIFCQQEFQQWFENHVQCPVCRYDIRNYRPASNSNSNSSTPHTNNINNNSIDMSNNETYNNETYNNETINTNSNQTEEVSFDISNNELSSSFVDNIASRIFQSLLFPQNQTDDPFMLDPSNNLFMFDPSNNILFYEAIMRPNSRNNTRR